MPDADLSSEPDDDLEPIPSALGSIGDFEDYYTPPQRLRSHYPHYDIISVYYTESGIQMMPVAAQTGFARPIRLHAPWTRKVIVWNAERIGLKPVLPHWQYGNDNEVLLKMVIVPHAPKLMAGGQLYYFKVEGIYVFGLFAALREGEAFYAGCTPCATDIADSLRTEGYQFSADLLASRPGQDYDADEVKAVP